MENLQNRFKQLMQRRIRYAIISGHEGLPHHVDKPIIMLFEAVSNRAPATSSDKLLDHVGLDRDIVSLMELEPLGDPNEVTYLLTAGAKQQKITLVPKGRGFMPEPFESRILGSVVSYQDVVAVPSADAHLPALLYHKMYHTDWLSVEPDKTLVELVKRYVSRIVGAKMTCEIPQFSQDRSQDKSKK